MNVFPYGIIILCMLDVLIYHEFGRNIFTPRYKNKWVYLLFFSVTSLFMYLVNLLHNPTVNLIVIPFGLIGISLLFYKDRVRRTVTYTFVFWFIVASMEFVGGLVYELLFVPDQSFVEGYPYNNFWAVAIIKLLTFIIAVIAKPFSCRKGAETKERISWGIIILPITTIVLFLGMYYANIEVAQNSGILGVGCISLLFTNIVIFFTFEKLTAVQEKNRVLEIEKIQYELNQQHYDRLEEINSDTRKFIHNLKEQLSAIGRLAADERNGEIIRILNDMDTNIAGIVSENYTSNKLLNAILCEKEQLAAKNHVAMSVSVEPYIELDHIKAGDMIVMVGNLLQNAIEAAGNCDKGFVDISIGGSDDKFIIIIVENNYAGRVEVHNGRYLSAKRGYREYGLGLRCVEETAEKYGGILYQQHGDGVFKAILTVSRET